MRRLIAISFAAAAVALPASFALGASGGQPQASKMLVSQVRTVSFSGAAGSVGPDVQGPIPSEIQKPKKLGKNPLRSDPAAGDAVPLVTGIGSPTSSGKKAKSNPEINLSFEGVNHRNSRLADGGNQFSGEPADQGLCVGNGYILETVNSALRVYDAAQARRCRRCSRSTSFTDSRRPSCEPRPLCSGRSHSTSAVTTIPIRTGGSTLPSISTRIPIREPSPARTISTLRSARRGIPPVSGLSIESPA